MALNHKKYICVMDPLQYEQMGWMVTGMEMLHAGLDWV